MPFDCRIKPIMKSMEGDRVKDILLNSKHTKRRDGNITLVLPSFKRRAVPGLPRRDYLGLVYRTVPAIATLNAATFSCA